MARPSKHDCVQGDRIISLEKDSNSMSKTLEDIKDNLNKNNQKLDEILIILAKLPIDFTTRKDFDIEKEINNTFRNKINWTIAYTAGATGAVSAIGIFLANKFIPGG